MADAFVGIILGGAIGGFIWIVFIKIFSNPIEVIGNYLEKKRGWPEWKISLCGYPVMLIFFYYYIALIIWVLEALGFN